MPLMPLIAGGLPSSSIEIDAGLRRCWRVQHVLA